MKITMLARSDVGITRAVNEDFCGIFEEDGLAVVCDGMGGHQAGAKASRLAVSTIRYMYLFLGEDVHSKIAEDLVAIDLPMAARLIGSVRLANRNIFNKSILEPTLRGMGTTVSALAVDNGYAIIAHVGDSRIYRFRDNEMVLLTEDHTWINELIQDNELKREEAEKFEKQNVITRALGLQSTVKIDLSIQSIQENDLFLICTDGLTKALSDKEIEKVVLFNKGNLDHTLKHLIDTANIKDGSDNITVSLISIEKLEPVQKTLEPIYVTLKPESEEISNFEDKVLKKELPIHNSFEWTKEQLSKIFKERYFQVSGIAAAVLIFVFIGFFAFSSHQEDVKESLAMPQREVALKITSKNRKPRKKRLLHPKPTTTSDQNSTTGAKVIPDSVINNLFSTLNNNQTDNEPGIEVSKNSLVSNSRNRGIVYLTGLEKIEKIEQTSIFVNNNYWGKTVYFWNKGLVLKPGIYKISIRDSLDNVLFRQEQIKVSVGDIKAIEYKK